MFDALGQIGGPEAIGALAGTLQSTADPREIASLAQSLEKLDPGQHQQDAVAIAHSHWNIYATVALAQMPDGAGVGALVNLAQVQDGSDPAARAAAVQMLGGLAAQSPEARTALVDLARADKLSAYNWGTLAPILSGEQYHFQNSVLDPSLSGTVPDDQGMLHDSRNQNLFFARAAGTPTPEQINQQTALIDQLLAVTSNPTAIQTLRRSKAMLSGSTTAQ